MFRDYVLGAEISEIGKFSNANISLAITDYELVIDADYKKFGGTVLFNKKSDNLPRYFRDIIKKCTSLEDLYPFEYINQILNGQAKSINLYDNVVLYKKRFVKFKDTVKGQEFKNLLHSEETLITVKSQEVPELYRDKLIKGVFKINNKHSLVWY